MCIIVQSTVHTTAIEAARICHSTFIHMDHYQKTPAPSVIAKMHRQCQIHDQFLFDNSTALPTRVEDLLRVPTQMHACGKALQQPLHVNVELPFTCSMSET